MTATLSSPSQEIRAQLLKDGAVDVLAKAYCVQVQFCVCACVNYQPQASHGSPHINYTPAFHKNDYIHVKEEYNEHWWIGRIVGHENQMVFIPREQKLKHIITETEPSKTEQINVYEEAPIMRPIIFLGPSIKQSKLSQLMQIPLVTSMKEKFGDRLNTITSSFPSNENAGDLQAQIFQAGRSLKLVFLDCAANFPEDFNSCSKIHPLFICIQVSRQKVLQHLIRQLTTTSRERKELLDGAYELSKASHQCSLLITENNVDDACQKLELFLESYWVSTRSILVT